MTTLNTLVTELSNEMLLNVANAHKYTLKNGETGLKTCSYPIEYKVTMEQINKAKSLVSEKIQAIAEVNKNKLFFYGRGWHKAENTGDVTNCRISVQFKNNKGRTFYLELTRATRGYISVDFAIDRDLEVKQNSLIEPLREKLKRENNRVKQNEILLEIRDIEKQTYYYNYKSLEREFYKLKIDWSKENILKLVNENFDCNFENIHVENFFYNNPFITHCQSL